MRIAVSAITALVLLVFPCTPLAQQNDFAPGREEVSGRIIDEELYYGQGYTILHVWGSHYEMGYAHGYLLAEWVELGYQEMKGLFGVYWPAIRGMVNGWTFLPAASEDEFQGMLDGVHAVYPETEMDLLDVKVASTYGDWSYALACRSTCCWADVVEPPFTTLSVRKLQFYLLPPQMTQQWHHVICAWEPDDGSPLWVNFGFPGYVSAVTGINEYGTTSSLHDWNSNVGTNHADALPRTMACRYALTMDLGPDPMTHAQTVFDELSNYHAATGGFLNYYVPDGGAGVIKTSKNLGFYALRLPQPEWMNGQVISTNNSDISGTYGISPWVSYYDTLDPEGGIRATMQGLWDTGYEVGDYHIVELGFRGHGDMTLWFTGRLQTEMLDRIELEWDDLFRDPAAVEMGEDVKSVPFVKALAPYPNPARGAHGGQPAVTIPFLAKADAGRTRDLCAILRVRIHDLSGRTIRTLAPVPGFLHPAASATGSLILFNWDGKDEAGRRVAAGVYPYVLSDSRSCVRARSFPGGLGPAQEHIIWLGW